MKTLGDLGGVAIQTGHVDASDARPNGRDREESDHLFFVHHRHAGNKAAMRAYLAWEQGLIAQLDVEERAVFKLDLQRGWVKTNG